MKRLAVIAIVAAAALILGLSAATIVRSSEARPLPPIDLRAPENTQQQEDAAAGEGNKKKQGPATRPAVSAPGGASPAPALSPAPAGGDDDGDDADDGGGDGD